MIIDHESLKTISTKTEQPNRILRFLDAIEHYGIRIVYRPGKANVLADYLSIPTHNAPSIYFNADFPISEIQNNASPKIRLIEQPNELNRLDLQVIFEYLQLGSSLPSAIRPELVKLHFTVHENKLYRVMKYTRDTGDPPHPGGLATQSLLLLNVPEFDELLQQTLKTHHQLTHATVGTTLRQLLTRYRHPEITLAAQQIHPECPQCQLMRRPDPTLPDLQPILPPPSLTRWAIDFTAFNGINILVAVEYATGWVEAEQTKGQTFADTVPLLTRICHIFGTSLEWIIDNAGCFNGVEAKEWHKQHDSKLLPTTPARPRGNGKVEKVNGDVKRLLVREYRANLNIIPRDLFPRVVMIKNCSPGPSNYSAFFLMLGTQPAYKHNADTAFTSYTRDPSEEEDIAFARELVRQHNAPLARSHAAGLRASRDAIRAYTQGKKAQLRIFASGDWVLRVRQRGHKHKPYYDGPWAIASCHPGNTYSLRSPGGIIFHGGTKYNGTNLFPAYVRDGHPVRSLWYASKKLLEEDRARLEKLASYEDI